MKYIGYIILIFLLILIFLSIYIYNTEPKIANIYIVNGLQFQDRYEETKAIVNKLKFKSQPIRYLAVYPENHNIYDETKKQYYTCKLKIGEIGCIMSHRKLWQNIQQQTHNNWNIIFEDDIVLPKDLTNAEVRRTMNKMLIDAQHQNIDVVYFGQCLSDLCTHAYAIRPHTAKVLYKNTYDCILGDAMKPNDNGKQLQIDVQMRILKNNKTIKCMYSSDEYIHEKIADYPRVKGLINQKRQLSTINIKP